MQNILERKKNQGQTIYKVQQTLELPVGVTGPLFIPRFLCGSIQFGKKI